MTAELRARHTVVPLHASIQERCVALGFDNLAPIIWSKIANVVHEVNRGGGGFLGKPYEPNAVVKNDIEFMLMQRKPGGYRRPTISARILSLLSRDYFRQCFRQIWDDVPGAPTGAHPAPFPVGLADRLVRMFSFVGDTVLDPFNGTAARRWQRPGAAGTASASRWIRSIGRWGHSGSATQPATCSARQRSSRGQRRRSAKHLPFRPQADFNGHASGSHQRTASLGSRRGQGHIDQTTRCARGLLRHGAVPPGPWRRRERGPRARSWQGRSCGM